MKRIVKPKPFFLKGGEQAVLLLHSFTSNTRDVRKLGKFLNENGFTCIAPIYNGHGLSPEQLVSTHPIDWWKNVEESYQLLKREGYSQIAVVGISLGGVFALNVGQSFHVNGIVIMSVPFRREVNSLKERLLNYARAFKQFEGKDDNQLSDEIRELEKSSLNCLLDFKNHIDETMKNLDKIDQPLLIMYGELDEPLYKESANYVYDQVCSKYKIIENYPNSGHLMTLGKDQEKIHKDILAYLKQFQLHR